MFTNWGQSTFVIPAKAYRDVGNRATQEAKAEAGIQEASKNHWIPAFAGMTDVFCLRKCHPGLTPIFPQIEK